MCESNESARRGECGKGSCTLANRNRALAAENVTAMSQPDRPTRTAEDPNDSWPNCQATVTQLACGQCSATLPLCAQLHKTNRAHMSEEAAMSENAEQKK
jgi:hypothetical protein